MISFCEITLSFRARDAPASSVHEERFVLALDYIPRSPMSKSWGNAKQTIPKPTSIPTQPITNSATPYEWEDSVFQMLMSKNPIPAKHIPIKVVRIPIRSLRLRVERSIGANLRRSRTIIGSIEFGSLIKFYPFWLGQNTKKTSTKKHQRLVSGRTFGSPSSSIIKSR